MHPTPTGRLRSAAWLGVLAAGLAACASSDGVVAPGATLKGDAADATPGKIVISQIYGGGGNSGSKYTNDFIELYNAGGSDVTVTGWSVQYASATGTSWQVTNLTGTIAPGQYYLVQESQGTGGNTPLPTPDATGVIAMSATAGKVALVNSSTALSGACPAGVSTGTSTTVVDFIGFGSTANCSEGSVAPAPSNTTADLRANDGKTDANNNATDFATGAPNPRNSAVSAPSTGEVVKVTLSPSPASGAVGATVQFSATAKDAKDQTVATTFTWTSSDQTVATVSGTGLATLKAQGQTTITATSANGTSGSATLTVNPAGQTTITRVTFSSSSTSFPAGFQTQLFATAFSGSAAADTVPQSRTTRTFQTVTPELATIDAATGIVTGVAPGRPTFRVTFTPTDGGAPFSADYTGIVIESRAEADSASTYGPNLEFGQPGPTGGNDNFLIRRRQFASSYNGSRGEPNWVSYEYDARQTGGEDRCNCFTTDPLTVAAGLPAITTADYTGSGYSRGHMTRSADRTTTNVENASTFYLSNIVPQNQDNNAGPWAAVENLLGDSTRAGRAVYVAAGPYFNPGPLRYLNNAGKVAIPDSVWKVAIIVGRDPSTGLPQRVTDFNSWNTLSNVTVIAVMMPNVGFAQGLNSDWHVYQRTADQVEAVTGYNVLNLLQAPYQDAVEAGDHAPVPALAGPTSGAVGQSLAFSAAGTTDPDANEALTYSWTFGEGTTATGSAVTKSYATAGSYTVTLAVTDRAGWTITRTQRVTVGDVAISASIATTNGGSSSATLAPNATLSVTARFSDPANRAPFRAVINWGDGTQATVTTSSQAAITRTHAWAAPGTYTVTFTVTARDGTASAPASLSVTVTP